VGKKKKKEQNFSPIGLLPNSKQKLNCALHAFISEARPGLSTFAGVVTHVRSPIKKRRV